MTLPYRFFSIKARKCLKFEDAEGGLKGKTQGKKTARDDDSPIGGSGWEYASSVTK